MSSIKDPAAKFFAKQAALPLLCTGATTRETCGDWPASACKWDANACKKVAQLYEGSTLDLAYCAGTPAYQFLDCWRRQDSQDNCLAGDSCSWRRLGSDSAFTCVPPAPAITAIASNSNRNNGGGGGGGSIGEPVDPATPSPPTDSGSGGKKTKGGKKKGGTDSGTTGGGKKKKGSGRHLAGVALDLDLGVELGIAAASGSGAAAHSRGVYRGRVLAQATTKSDLERLAQRIMDDATNGVYNADKYGCCTAYLNNILTTRCDNVYTQNDCNQQKACTWVTVRGSGGQAICQVNTTKLYAATFSSVADAEAAASDAAACASAIANSPAINRAPANQEYLAEQASCNKALLIGLKYPTNKQMGQAFGLLQGNTGSCPASWSTTL